MTDVNRVLYPIHEAREQLGGLGNTSFYKLVNAGHIKLTKIGRRSFVSAVEIDRFVGNLPNIDTEKLLEVV